MIGKNGEKKVKIKGFVMVVEENGMKANVTINEKALRTMFKHIPELNGKEVLWNSGQNKVTIKY